MEDSNEVDGKPYEFETGEFEEMTDEERQAFFLRFRITLHAYWQAKAEYELEQQQKRAERKDRFRYDP